MQAAIRWASEATRAYGAAKARLDAALALYKQVEERWASQYPGWFGY